MLAARRDPIPDHGTPDIPLSPHPGPAPHRPAATPAFARFIAGVQIVGTVLGIPLGLASGYSIYRANFSPEATCGTLRANIISMLDKNADASTLRLLVRRDVASFERSCAAVDPDAVAAFKTLLDKPTAVAKVAPKETKPARAAQAPRPDAAKRVVAKAAPVAAEANPVRANPDADWLAAVRQALVEHAPVVRAQAAEAPASLVPPAADRPMGALLPVQAHAAPALPPATNVADAPALRADDNHPIPPASIPNVGPPPAR